ncbi:Domain of unknown function DUF1849 [Parvibaculum lavamentivorans DS-1]|uniref:ATP/GTP-binding site motif A n=1 Tax=Parvibaculum lavamentivorans (strain DS-1 / DSM 13023 / NCIMB 13966) TaxID=402881 RepID=A7HWY3_PARL1|nr:cell envelope integrity EipB family protein [Parvibaculum lavamentivorans]ABS64416.1 Domain of unknown function DUF1849 [Parvibaculum lavamentivorans DS-1]
MTRSLRIARFSAIFIIAGSMAAEAAPTLQMHRAVYDLTLGRTQPVSDITGIRGRMVVEWRGGPKCGGYTSLQRVVTHVTGVDDDSVSNDVRLSYWEAADGDQFTFTRTEYTNGQLTGQEEGSAERDKNGGSVRVFREGDEPLAMPGDVLFPIAYNLALIEKAQAGQRVFSRALFDGTEPGENPTTAFIGKPLSKQWVGEGVEVEGEGKSLSAMRPWPVRISYFDPADREGVPSFEMGYVLFPNGIAAELTLDYLDVQLKGRLSELTYFAPDSC